MMWFCNSGLQRNSDNNVITLTATGVNIDRDSCLFCTVASYTTSCSSFKWWTSALITCPRWPSWRWNKKVLTKNLLVQDSSGVIYLVGWKMGYFQKYFSLGWSYWVKETLLCEWTIKCLNIIDFNRFLLHSVREAYGHARGENPC